MLSFIVTWRAGSEENSGQIASEGVPKRSTISSNWPSSERPGNSGRCPNSSPSMQPAAHMSTEVVWVRACSSSSGALYHKVTTRGVIGRKGRPNQRAKPKSAIRRKVQNLETCILYTFCLFPLIYICIFTMGTIGVQAGTFTLQPMWWIWHLGQINQSMKEYLVLKKCARNIKYELKC